MKMIPGSIWVLYKSFFQAVPGQKGLLAIGFLLMALGYLQHGSSHATLFVMAGTAFATGFTLLFAGPHFRQLASFRRHRLLPDFRKQLITSYLLALASLSLFALLGLVLLENAVPQLRLNGVSTGIVWLSLFGVVLVVSFMGFLPRHLRYPTWLLVVVGALNLQHIGLVPIELLLSSSIGIAMVSLGCFLYFVGIARKPIFYSKRAVSVSKYLPGLNGGFQERGVTAVGSILLGISDGNVSRFLRTFSAAFLLPMALACATLLTGKQSAEQLFKNPLFLLMGLMTGVLMQIHFAFAVSARRRFIWLRIGGSRQKINQVAQRVLARERWAMVFCYALWCAPVISLYPNTAVWLLGVSTLLWCMLLLLEQLILTLKDQRTQRAEFYMLLVFIGIVIGIIAVANVHRQPGTLWLGVAGMFSLYSVLKLNLKAK